MANSVDIFQYISQPDLKTILINTVDFVQSQVEVTTIEITCSFTVTSIAAAGQGDIYVAGIARDGDLVIEHWQVAPQTGEIRTAWQPSGVVPDIGLPSPSAAPTSTIVGGTYVPPAQRVGEAHVTRVEVLRTDQFTIQNNAFGVDPEGRFLLLVTTDAELYRIDLSEPTPPPVLLHDSTSLWTLPHVLGMARFDVTGAGRIWVLGPAKLLPNPTAGGEPRILVTYLYDSENDGLFEQAVVHDYEVLSQSGLWDLIESNFVFLDWIY